MKSLQYNYSELAQASTFLCTQLEHKQVLALSGDLGAGKTTLTHHVVAELGCNQPVTSPTFSYLNRYETKYGMMYHFDLYRLASLDDFYELGFDEYLYKPSSLCIIEWPEIVSPLFNEQVAWYTLDVVNQETRILREVNAK